MSPDAQLPVEIWIEILRQATYGPVWRPSWRRPQMVTTSPYQEWKTSMVIKWRVVRVCKDWYSIGIPFLYEHIVVRTYKRIPKFAPYLSQTSAIDQRLGTLGDHTMRLDIGLLQHLPNLRAFAAVACTVTIDVFNALPPALEYFDMELLPHFPPQPSLCCSPLVRHTFDGAMHALAFSPQLVLGQLVELRSYPSPLLTDCLPALSSLQKLGLKWWSPTLLRHDVVGRNLTSLCLSPVTDGRPGFWRAVVTLALEHCTNLEYLGIMEVENFDLAQGISTSLRTFGVQLSALQLKASECNRTFKRLLKAKECEHDIGVNALAASGISVLDHLERNLIPVQ
ncbi:hypothetical protein BKA70DRAFT_1249506 [Coprinopsis sp. MPI-PUGE-AT-0042]|nr:hypothetical protein BKA70DRAFT_1249506 [Coprinopsis sp. MPI-PUGE-AT-0042]